MKQRLDVLATILRNATLVRVMAAFLAFSIAEWATWFAVVIYAYGRGGATEAGIVAFVQLVPSILVAPAAGSLGDRFPRARVLVGAYVVQGASMAFAAAALAGGLSAVVVYGLATLAATSVTLTRPVHAAFLPHVVDSVDELTAANILSAGIEGTGMLVGPALGGVLTAAAGPQAVFASSGVGLLLGAAAVLPVARAVPTAVRPSAWIRPAAASVRLGRTNRRRRMVTRPGIRPRRTGAGTEDPNRAFEPASAPFRSVRPNPPRRGRMHPPAARGDRNNVGREVAAGLVAIRSDARLLALATVLGCAMLILGTLDIFYAVLAFELLDLGESGLGLLAAATGAGVVAGSAVAVTLVGRSRLGAPIAAGAIAFGVSVLLLGLAPGAVISAMLLAASGVAFQYLYVAVQTATQRVAPDIVMTRVFGAFEALRVAVTAIGALSVPVMVALFGASGAFVVTGMSLPIIVAVAARALGRMDRTAVVRSAELRLLRRIPMFAPLSAPVLESFARNLVTERFAPGSTIIRQGDAGDRYFIVARGSVSVDVDGRFVGTEGPGEGFGEIALLRDVPRTATVRALDEVEVVTLAREPFLEGLTGLPASRAEAERVADARLAGIR